MPSPLGCCDLALDAPLAEAAGHEDALALAQLLPRLVVQHGVCRKMSSMGLGIYD